MLMLAAGARGGATELDGLIERILLDGDTHLTGGPADEAELRRLEAAIGARLPGSLRAFLARVGPGLFYQGHEIFGPLRVMVHDIELVPDLESMLVRLQAEPSASGLVPFHRVDGRWHCFDLHDPASAGRIVSWPSGSSYRDLAAFLRAVVLP